MSEKNLMKFVTFDIKEVYPSIKQDLLEKVLNLANKYVNILKCDIDVIHHA